MITLLGVSTLAGCNISSADALSQSQEQSASQTQTLNQSPDILPNAITDIGQGNTKFRFEMTESENAVAVWNVHTDEQTVGAALLVVGLINGDESEYGLYINEVNGVVADYNVDKSYWAFYIDGEYGMAGVDATNIEPDKTYSFVYTKD